MSSGGGLIVTVDTYYSPLGREIHKKGIEPTVEVIIDEKYRDYPADIYTDEIDTQLGRAVEIANM